jgi:signal transduction histidine kinase
VRFISVLVFLPALGVLHFVGGAGWDTYVGPVSLFAVLAAATFFWRQSPWVARLAPYSFVVDVALVFEVQRRAMPHSQFPAGVAGFSMGLFALLLAMTASTMRGPATWAVALASALAQVTLMNLAGVGAGAQVLAVVVFALLTFTEGGVRGRVRQVVRSLADAEVAWRREHEHVTELTEARATIEHLLVESRAQNAKLLALQADKESLTSLLVHDLRAPLGAVRANLDWVKGELPKDFDEEVISALSEARQVTDRLAGMIGDLLNITRLENGALPLDRQPQPCAAMLEALHKQLQAQARSRRITVELDVHDLVLEADHSLLMRTLENISSNALRYTPSGGRIRLEGRAVGNEVLFAVRNDGPVIPDAARAALFEKYVQAGSAQENRRAGWGLGLYFCKLCVDAHGGRIGVEDEPGWPTSFIIRVPGVITSLRAA